MDLKTRERLPGGMDLLLRGKTEQRLPGKRQEKKFLGREAACTVALTYDEIIYVEN